MTPCINEIEYWLAKKFNYRQNIVVPNISWGLSAGYDHDGHECDLIVLRPSGYAAEIEIKRSLADLKAENKKRHIHASNIIREFWFAIPADILDKSLSLSLIPDRAGVMTYERCTYNFSKWTSKGYQPVSQSVLKIKEHRKPKINTKAVRFSVKQREKLLQLAHMRIWTMKRQMYKEG